MQKADLLQELRIKLAAGEVSHEEVTKLLGLTSTPAIATPVSAVSALSHVSLMKVLYLLGGVIIVVGIVIFVGQIWDDITSGIRILITLGLGLLFALYGSILLKSKPGDTIGAIFHFVGGLLVPLGLLVLMTELDMTTEMNFAMAFLMSTVFYILLTIVHKNPILSFFAIANATATLYLYIAATLGEIPNRMMDTVYAYLTMLIGMSYILLGHSFKSSWNKPLVGTLYFFGSLGFLLAAFTRVFDSSLWESLYFVVVSLGILLAIKLKSRVILVFSTLFLVAHVTYITGQYFAESLGWPIALIFLGFVFIGLGYMSVRINRNYIAE